MKLLCSVFTFIIIFYCQIAVSQHVKNNGTDINPIDTIIKNKMGESGIVGLSAAIIIDKKLIWMKGYGYADKDNKVPFTPNTIMNIASISKTFTGVCLLKAVEDKKLSLDEDINTYLPFKVINPFFPDEKITLRNLATHTSSIMDRESVYDSTYHYGGDSPEPLGEFLRSYFDPTGKRYTMDNFLNKKPGSYREYSNIAAGLAGYIVEIVTGKKLNEYSRQYIFKPLKMDNTGWFLSEVKLENHSRLYDKQGDTLKTIPLYGCTTYPDGGVRTSVSELSRFFIALLSDGEYKGKRILKKESVEEMQRYQFTDSNKPENINPSKLNSGIFWATKQSGTKIGHSGTDPGVKTEMLSDLSKKVAVILFTNTTLTEKDMLTYYYAIYNELCKYGIQLKDAKSSATP
ncbi:serine hydrolase domain-containing protein [Xanthocytophaga flava]|uniref:serine hydrolase domain-containing protein n=1 Tax=Xanthocytophaga flava TaxID=3048013 RepID=UPI0028D62D67|nr:serine hydrolase domain-containing protein [Xanthocytophaga flavus]MDJ1472554.1 serine hydrolase domain-containing protein [Xanthocytophaga flavus]